MPGSSIICEVLGYKFRHFSESGSTPTSLYQITAVLLKFSVINLNDIYSWVSLNNFPYEIYSFVGVLNLNFFSFFLFILVKSI